MKQYFIFFTFSASIMLATACNNGTTTNKEDSVDSAREANDSMPSTNTDASDFMTKAASGGMLEVQLGQMAQQKGVSQRVKDFGLMMIRDHTKNNDELKAIAQQKGLTIPQTLSDDHQKHLDDYFASVRSPAKHSTHLARHLRATEEQKLGHGRGKAR